MILHLFFDEKFIDYAISHFEQTASSHNVFAAVVPSHDYEFKYIQQKGKVKLIVDSDEGVNSLMTELYQYDAVIFHSLFPLFFLKILYFADPNRIKLVWFFWGGEFYDHPSIVKKYLGKSTLQFFYTSNFKRILWYPKRIVRKMIGKNRFDIEKNIHKLTHTVITKEEYEIIKKRWNIDSKILWYSYYSIETVLGNMKDERATGNNVFIGNSATATNNHLEVFQILKKIELNDRKIVVPLSYGNDNYKNHIAECGKNIWGNKFIPLLSFMDRELYNQYFLDCNIVIMNHYRQQAVGNVITSLWLGAKLFMSERSPVYKDFKNKGIIIYTVENDLHPENSAIFTPLTSEEMNHNRNILYKQFSLLNILQNVDLLINELSI